MQPSFVGPFDVVGSIDICLQCLCHNPALRVLYGCCYCLEIKTCFFFIFLIHFYFKTKKTNQFLIIASLTTRCKYFAFGFQWYVETARRIVKVFTFGYYTILVFSLPNGMAIFQQGPLMGTSNASAVWKKSRDFLPIFYFVSEMIHDAAIVTMECE